MHPIPITWITQNDKNERYRFVFENLNEIYIWMHESEEKGGNILKRFYLFTFFLLFCSANVNEPRRQWIVIIIFAITPATEFAVDVHYTVAVEMKVHAEIVGCLSRFLEWEETAIRDSCNCSVGTRGGKNWKNYYTILYFYRISWQSWHRHWRSKKWTLIVTGIEN